MRVVITADYDEMSDRAAQIVLEAIQKKPDIVLGLATGSTPEGLYERLVQAYKDGRADFSRVVTFNLDEYVGLSPDHQQSYRYFMNEKLFDHINIKKENTHVPDGQAPHLLQECERYEEMIRQAGGIDLQVLGIGREGHIGFNSPGTAFHSRTHVAVLTETTVQDNARFFDSAEEVPRFAVTMGIGSILDARRCVLLASGSAKAEAIKATVEGPLNPLVSASALQFHPDTVVIADEEAASRLELADYYRWREENWGQIADRL